MPGFELFGDAKRKVVKDGLAYLTDKTFDKSDYYIGRNLSCLIKLSWTEAEVKQRDQTMAKLIREATTYT